MPYVPGGKWEDRPRVGCSRCVSECWDGPVGPHTKSCGCPCAPEGCKHAASWEVQDRVDEMQRRLRPRFLTEYGWANQAWHPPMIFNARSHMENLRANLRRDARWLELQAMRRYTGVVDDDGLTSWERDLRGARNYRWLVELMDAGRSVTRDAHGVYIDGELASVVQARAERAEQRQRDREQARVESKSKESTRPSNPYKRRQSR